MSYLTLFGPPTNVQPVQRPVKEAGPIPTPVYYQPQVQEVRAVPTPVYYSSSPQQPISTPVYHSSSPQQVRITADNEMALLKSHVQFLKKTVDELKDEIGNLNDAIKQKILIDTIDALNSQ